MMMTGVSIISFPSGECWRKYRCLLSERIFKDHLIVAAFIDSTMNEAVNDLIEKDPTLIQESFLMSRIPEYLQTPG